MPTSRPRERRRAFRPAVEHLERLQLLDASQATLLPMSLTSADLSNPATLLADLPIVTTSMPEANPPASASASLSASATELTDLPSAASLANPAAPNASPFGIRPMTLASTSALRAFATALADGSDSGAGSGSGSDSASGGSGSGMDSGSGSSSDSGSGGPETVFSSLTYTVNLSDGAGDSGSVTVAYTISPDGTFSFDVTIASSYGASPSADTGSDDQIPANGGTSSFHFGVSAGPNSVTFAEDQTGQDSYNVDEALSGATNSGTWTDSSNSHDSITLNDDGSGSETDSSDSKSSDKYKLSATGTTADGHGFNFTDSGKDSSTYHDAGGAAADGTATDAHNEDDTSTATVTQGESGGGLKATDTATRTLGYHDNDAPVPGATGASTDTVTKTDDGNDSSSYQNSGTINGASFTVSDQQQHNHDDSETDTTGAATGSTDNRTEAGTNTDTFKLTLSGVDDSSGYGSGSGSGSGSSSGSGSDSGSSPSDTSDSLTMANTSGGTFHDQETTVTGPDGSSSATGDDSRTGQSSNSESGTDPDGPFSESSSGSDSVEITSSSGPAGVAITGDTETSSPPNQKVTGTPPEDIGSMLPMESDATMIEMPAYGGVSGGGASNLNGDAASPANPSPDDSPGSSVSRGAPAGGTTTLDSSGQDPNSGFFGSLWSSFRSIGDGMVAAGASAVNTVYDTGYQADWDEIYNRGPLGQTNTPNTPGWAYYGTRGAVGVAVVATSAAVAVGSVEVIAGTGAASGAGTGTAASSLSPNAAAFEAAVAEAEASSTAFAGANSELAASSIARRVVVDEVSFVRELLSEAAPGIAQKTMEARIAWMSGILESGFLAP